MKKTITKRILAVAMTAGLLATSLVGCSSSPPDTTEGSASERKTYQLKVATIVAMPAYTPAYICEEKGWFEEAGLDYERLTFSNGPTIMEASDSWDIAVTGIGGVVAGLMAHDVSVIAAGCDDYKTNRLWARPDSPIVQAGTGNNTVSDKIYGTADTWRGAQVLCSSGTAQNIMLVEVLKGFGLTTDDVAFTVMDLPSANTAFKAGEGDVAASVTAVSFAEDKKDYVAVAGGEDLNMGMMSNLVVNNSSLKDPVKREAIKIFLKQYYRGVDWQRENPKEAAEYMSVLFEDDAYPCDTEVAFQIMKADYQYGLEESFQMMNTKAEGKEYTVMEDKVVQPLEYFISFGNYPAEAVDKVLDGKFDNTLINELYQENQGS